jgi:hypothetical protein
LAGCYEVKRTEGLRAAYEKILLANDLLDKTSAGKDLSTDKLKPLIDSYNQATVSVNSFLDVIADKSVNGVDVPLSDFYTSDASSDLDRFISNAVNAMAEPDAGQMEKAERATQNDEQSKQGLDNDTMGNLTDERKTEKQKKEREKKERQREEVKRFEGIAVSANAKVKGIMELNGNKSEASYKRFKSLINGLKMNALPLQRPESQGPSKSQIL